MHPKQSISMINASFHITYRKNTYSSVQMSISNVHVQVWSELDVQIADLVCMLHKGQKLVLDQLTQYRRDAPIH